MDDSASTPPLTVTRAGILGTILVIIVAAVCIRLGFWQLDRLAQRRARNDVLAQRINQPPTRLTHLPNDTAQLSYRRVRIAGQYDHDRSIVLAGRSLRGVPGVYILTPLHIGAEGAVLVNRGWVGAADAATVELDSLRTPADADAVGIVLPLPNSHRPQDPSLRSRNFRRVWYTTDPEAIRGQFPYRVANLEVQLLPDSGAPPFPIRLRPPETTEGPHLGYAIQWFSFALIAVIGWLVLVLRKAR